jgi:hypothetical protein
MVLASAPKRFAASAKTVPKKPQNAKPEKPCARSSQRNGPPHSGEAPSGKASPWAANGASANGSVPVRGSSGVLSREARRHPAEPPLACQSFLAGAVGGEAVVIASRSSPHARARCSAVRSQTSSAMILTPFTPVRRSTPHTAIA